MRPFDRPSSQFTRSGQPFSVKPMNKPSQSRVTFGLLRFDSDVELLRPE